MYFKFYLERVVLIHKSQGLRSHFTNAPFAYDFNTGAPSYDFNTGAPWSQTEMSSLHESDHRRAQEETAAATRDASPLAVTPGCMVLAARRMMVIGLILVALPASSANHRYIRVSGDEHAGGTGTIGRCGSSSPLFSPAGTPSCSSKDFRQGRFVVEGALFRAAHTARQARRITGAITQTGSAPGLRRAVSYRSGLASVVDKAAGAETDLMQSLPAAPRALREDCDYHAKGDYRSEVFTRLQTSLYPELPLEM